MVNERVAMTPEEISAMNHLVEFWERYRTLPESDSSEVSQVCLLINQIQGMFSLRIARRADPAYWRKPE